MSMTRSPPGLVCVRTLSTHRYVAQRTVVENTIRVEIVEEEVLVDVQDYHPVDLRQRHTTPIPGRPLYTNLLDDTFSDPEIYSTQLLPFRRGYPLYVPAPAQNLPPEYRRTGIAIGDVGRLTDEGIFDFFFNIYLPADHPINNNDVPESFVPLGRYVEEDVFEHEHEAGSYISTPSVRRVNEDGTFPGGEFRFRCHAPQGAVLALPHGSHATQLQNLRPMREYATAHAENWYRYVNGRRGRRLPTDKGLLYLVTGWEKAQSWGMAAFYGLNSAEFELRFKPSTRDGQYRWSGNPAEKKSYDPSGSPDDGGGLNQTTFIHGLAVSLRPSMLGRMFQTVDIRDINDLALDQRRLRGGNVNINRGFTSPFSWLLNLFGMEAWGGTQRGNVVLSNSIPSAKVQHFQRSQTQVITLSSLPEGQNQQVHYSPSIGLPHEVAVTEIYSDLSDNSNVAWAHHENIGLTDSAPSAMVHIQRNLLTQTLPSEGYNQQADTSPGSNRNNGLQREDVDEISGLSDNRHNVAGAPVNGNVVLPDATRDVPDATRDTMVQIQRGLVTRPSLPEGQNQQAHASPGSDFTAGLPRDEVAEIYTSG
ncbi:hypothetical protein C8R47DRAFT_1087807 [Mycena vitilis]|nr:hypothetical protein C8R47DRAFT_1087807 [Mycena vitilis]